MSHGEFRTAHPSRSGTAVRNTESQRWATTAAVVSPLSKCTIRVILPWPLDTALLSIFAALPFVASQVIRYLLYHWLLRECRVRQRRQSTDAASRTITAFRPARGMKGGAEKLTKEEPKRNAEQPVIGGCLNL
jgi:hypothetical protein